MLCGWHGKTISDVNKLITLLYYIK